MYDGKPITEGDTVFVFVRDNEDALIARGILTGASS
jgi:hypothetical protein